MPSFPRYTLIPNDWLASQTFQVITVNGVKCRPFVRMTAGSLKFGWEFDIYNNGQWVEESSRTENQ